MRVVDEAFRLLRHFEGLRLQWYIDANGHETIGYGHKKRDEDDWAAITEEHAEILLGCDVFVTADLVEHLLRPQTLNDNQFSALVCFTFNEGYKRLKDSFLLRCVGKNDWAAATTEFGRWVYIGKEVSEWQRKRRAREAALFNKPI